jgi:dephospho-CoA kinase
MEKQLSDEKKIKLADIVIENITMDKFYFQAKELLIKLKK